MIARCEDCGRFTAVTYPVWLGVPNYTIDRDVCRRCAEARGLVTAHHPADATSPSEVIHYLQANGWTHSATLRAGELRVAHRWQRRGKFVTVPLLPSAPDFQLRWDEMLRRLREVDAGADGQNDVEQTWPNAATAADLTGEHSHPVPAEGDTTQ